jgi:hypothetical protein
LGDAVRIFYSINLVSIAVHRDENPCCCLAETSESLRRIVRCREQVFLGEELSTGT